MYRPTIEEFRLLAKPGITVPVYRELSADLETPVSIYLKVGHHGESFLLESVEGADMPSGRSLLPARYSFIGARASHILTIADGQVRVRTASGDSSIAQAKSGRRDPLDALRQFLMSHRTSSPPGLPSFFGGAVGFFSFDMVRYFEPLRARSSAVGATNTAVQRDPYGNNQVNAQAEGKEADAILLLTDTVVAFDHLKHQATIIAHARVRGAPEEAYADAVSRIERVVERIRQPLPTPRPLRSANGRELEPEITPEAFAAQVRQAQEHIREGDIYQVVLSERFRRETNADAFEIYRALRRLNPSPYMFFLDLGAMQLVGSSPEVLVRLEGDRAELNPIAGTRRRGSDATEDGRLEAELLADPKERAEHVMLVDLGRNDLGRVCTYGSVEVLGFMMVEKYSHVMHLVSRVGGRLRPGLDAFDLFKATFPAGTVSGAPKIRAIEIIDELEPTGRGPYAGAVGYFGFPDETGRVNMDFCITIRTIFMRGRQAVLQAGAGIVADSVPELEHQECVNKASALAEAIRIAESEAK
jgi:anthranilate synthase component I